ncbi:MAG: hypothetical protein HZB68_05365 [Candidatus Aenigmarchaeota archaeon]|nr:hypothetical protein [Candidatus Aenigmarchaeota archaeon]
MKKNPFGMYDGVGADNDDALQIEASVIEDTEKIEMDAKEVKYPEYYVRRSYVVPNGTYLVRGRANVRSHNTDYRARWMLDAQESQVYDTQPIPAEWSVGDSDWIDDIRVKDGKLSLTLTLSRSNNELRRAYMEWVEFSYRRRE